MQVSRFWRTTGQRYQLVGEVCPKCGTKIFPPRDVCPACEAEAKTPFVFSGRGEVYSFSTVHNAPEGFEKYAPYTVALIRLEEGPLITAQLTDVDEKDVYIGMPVEMVTRVLREDGERGIIVYGYKFRPRREAQTQPLALAA
ncbi:MAG: Zn-ribbon domain-containing OB-fold protein [Anaerolineae bacterium]|nr:Zn-ribbon domain-containing OB-fold protein [Thermoflexales bacterium]MDW8395924.1 Zn-ribbon domain-containing OB-fold protein [Anaerolineae bacterium]